MNSMRRAWITFGAVLTVMSLFQQFDSLLGQGGAPGQLPTGTSQGQGAAVALPTMSGEITGPGPVSTRFRRCRRGTGSSAPARSKEYLRHRNRQRPAVPDVIVVRKPANNTRFSGLVFVEAMHGSGAAHMFESTSIYTMTSGHPAIEIRNDSPMYFVGQTRLDKDLQIADGQANDILAQVGALIKNGMPPGGLAVRKMVLAGTSQMGGISINYLLAHMVDRMPQMQRIDDGSMPTSNGSTMRTSTCRSCMFRRCTRSARRILRGVRMATSRGRRTRGTSSRGWRTSTRAIARG